MVISSFHDITEIVVQSKKIEEQKKNLEDIIEGLSEAVMVADVNGKFITINSAAKNMIYGWEKLSNSGDTSKYSKYFNMEGDEIAPENIPGIRALRGERIKSTKMFVSDPDREYFMEISSTPIYNIGGDLTMAVSSFRDITEAIEQSRKIDELKKELEAIIENLPTGVSVFDSEGQNILSNKASRTMFTTSLSSEQMDKLGDIWKVAEYYDIDGEKVELENIPSRRVLRGEKFNDSRMVLKIFNTEFHIDFSGIPIYDSNKRFIMGMVYSQNRAAYVNEEKAFKSRYDLVEKIIDTFDLPVVRISCPDLKLVDLNKKAFSVLKLVVPDIISIDQLKNNTIIDIFATAKSIEYHKFMGQVIIEKKTKYLNKIMFLLNGNPIYWNIIFEPVFKVNGEIEEILILLIDVTDEIKSNNVMEKTLRLQEEFIANISHELKTPLSVISSAVQLFSLYCERGSLDNNRNSIVKYIDSIKQNSNRLSKLINNIVDSSKIEAGFFELNLSNNNIVQVVEELVMSVTNFTESKGLNIIFDTNIEEKIMACDPEKIDRILLNLISNAIKFSNVGDEIIVAINDMNEFVEISVKDSGIGIETKHLDMIFDRFKQVDKTLSRNAEGTGIGLSLVKSIAELHGGNICVESELGKGSKFTVKLPTQKTLQENTVYNCDESSVNEIMLLEFSDIFQ